LTEVVLEGVEELEEFVADPFAVAAASRYMAGGQQVGGPILKGTLSRMAGRSLRVLAHVGTRDATNSFKAYSTEFLREVGIVGRVLWERAGRSAQCVRSHRHADLCHRDADPPVDVRQESALIDSL